MPEPPEEPGPEARAATPRGQRNEKGQTPSEAKREQAKALTGVTSEMGCLNMQRSSDAVQNVKYSLFCKLTVFKRKSFTWMLRMKEAHRRSGMAWRRSPRWLSLMFGNQLSGMWGHLGAAAQYVRGLKGAALMR